MSKHTRGAMVSLTALLFGGAGVAFSASLYALGIWLALGTVACGALALSAAWFSDRPATLAALDALTQAQALAGVEVMAHLKHIEGKCEFLATHLSVLSTARTAPGRLQSPLRPPSGNGPRG